MTETKWQPIETAPKNAGVQILGAAVGDTTSIEVIQWDDLALCWRGKDNGKRLGGITHWMRLPPPPERL